MKVAIGVILEVIKRKFSLFVYGVSSEGSYWVDGNNNKWNKKLYTRKEAAAASATLIDCHDCVNCKHCVNCRSCSNCIACIRCIQCCDCVASHICSNSIHLSQCVLCKESLYLKGVSNTKNKMASVYFIGDNDAEVATYFEKLPASKEQLLSFMNDVKEGKKGTLKHTK